MTQTAAQLGISAARITAWAECVQRLIAVAPTEAVISETGIAWTGHSTPPERKALREKAHAVVASWLARDLAILDTEAELGAPGQAQQDIRTLLLLLTETRAALMDALSLLPPDRVPLLRDTTHAILDAKAAK